MSKTCINYEEKNLPGKAEIEIKILHKLDRIKATRVFLFLDLEVITFSPPVLNLECL